LQALFLTQPDSATEWLYFNLHDFTVSPDGPELSSDRVALGFYQRFFKYFINELVRSASERTASTSKWYTSLASRGENRAQEIGVELLDIVQQGEIVPAFAELLHTSMKEKAHTSSGSASAKANLSEAGATGSLELEVGKVRNDSQTQVASFETRPQIGLTDFKRKIEELLDELAVDNLVILFDEWTSLDRDGSTDIQPYFADFLQRFFGRSSRFTIKIAANRSYTTLFRSGIGMEFGDDYSIGINLDRRIYGEADRQKFFELLLFKRIQHYQSMPAIRSSDGNPVAGWLSEIFAAGAFPELVRGSNGNPRVFIQLFGSAFIASEKSLQNKISPKLVRQIIRDRSVENTSDLALTSGSRRLLRGPVREVMERTGIRSFIVATDDAELLNPWLEELVDRKVLNERQPEDMFPAVRDVGSAFELSYGQMLDWDREFKDAGELDWKPTAEAISASTLDASSFNQSKQKCPKCQGHFSSSHALVTAHQICPLCYEKLKPEAEGSPAGPAAREFDPEPKRRRRWLRRS